MLCTKLVAEVVNVGLEDTTEAGELVVEVVKLLSPLYVAVIEYVPGVVKVYTSVATLLVTVAGVPIAVPLAKKVTVPVGLPELPTVAVSVTGVALVKVVFPAQITGLAETAVRVSGVAT